MKFLYGTIVAIISMVLFCYFDGAGRIADILIGLFDPAW